MPTRSFGSSSRVHASINSSASAHAMPGALVTNITASPMRLATLAPDAAITSPVVASKRASIDASSDASSWCDRPV